MDSQWVQWVPLLGFGSVVTILIAIVGGGIVLWCNASIAYRSINDEIDRMGSRLESKLSTAIAKVHQETRSHTKKTSLR